MTDYRETVRLKNPGFSERNIALGYLCSRNTVLKVSKRSEELGIAWPLTNEHMNAVLKSMLYPKGGKSINNKKMLDLSDIHKELFRNGVSKKLRWTEFMEDCCSNGVEPLMYSQFCYYIQQDERKRRATMHIDVNQRVFYHLLFLIQSGRSVRTA